MKKIIATLLATTLAVATLAGCTVKDTSKDNVKNNESVVIVDSNDEKLVEIKAKIAEKAGIDEVDKTVIMNIAGYELTLAEYEYLYFSQLNNALRYSMYYGFEMLESEEFIQQMTDMFAKEVKTAPIVLALAAENGISMTDEEIKTTVLDVYDQMKEQYGEEFETVFADKATPTVNSILYYNYIYGLYNKLMSVYTVTDEMKAECKAKAEEVLAKAKNGEDFDALITEFNEDPGMTTYTDGYYFSYGEMVEAFETTSFALADNEISGLVETPYGYHIIKRLPVDDEFKETSTYKEVYESLSAEYEGEELDAKLAEYVRAKHVLIQFPDASNLFYEAMEAKAAELERVNVENFDELVAPVHAEAEETYNEYKAEFQAMLNATKETTEPTEE